MLELKEVFITSLENGEPLTLSGRLHIITQVFVSADTATQFDIHPNLMEGTACTLDGSACYPAVGAFDDSFVPDSPMPPTNPVPTWTLTFDIARTPNPLGPTPVPFPNTSKIVLPLQTMFGADGSLTSANVIENIIVQE